MDIRLLGTVELDRDGERVHLTGRRTRSLLALLSLNAGRVVPVERILRLVWPGEATSAARLLQKQVSALRGLLRDPEQICRQGSGYVLHASRTDIDVHIFEDNCKEARSALASGNLKAAAELLREALALWRGPALAGTTDALTRAFGPGLEERLLAARCDHIDAAIDLGASADILGELTELIDERPFDERLRRMRLLALDRTDRRGEAIGEYHEFRRVLDDEFGVEPGGELQAAYAELIAERRAKEAPVARQAVPRQLPPAPRHFVGRTDMLAALDAAVEAPAASVALVGSPGIGKTALALHWAHLRTAWFPEGQIYLNLRGYDESEPMSPATALNLLLMAVATPETQIPSDLDARTAAWRTAVAGKRMLIVLDNVRGTEQLRPLLPGTPETSIVVTSRDMLSGLVASEGTTRLVLDHLTPEESRDLVGKIVGAERLAAQPDAAQAIVKGCAHLPLALHVAAERAARRPGLPLSAVAGELTDELRRFEVLDGGDALTRVRGVITWSLRDLPDDTARLFRLLGIHPNAEPTAHFAANLTGLEPGAAERCLETLANASLLTSTGADGYGLHDLLRAYAAAATRDTDDEATRRQAMDGILTWYRHTANAAMDMLAPLRNPTPRPCPPPLFPQPPFTDERHAAEWLTRNLQSLSTAIQIAADANLHHHVRDLHYPLTSFLLQRRDVDQALHTLHLAATAAASLGDPAANADIEADLGNAHAIAHRLTEARTHHELAARLYEEAGDPRGQSAVLRGMGIAAARAGDLTDALVLFERAVEAAKAADIPSEVARSSVNIGNVHTHLGAFDKALPLMRSGYEYFTIAGDHTSATAALAGVSYSLCELGELDSAAEHATRAVEAARRLGAISLEEHGLLNLAMARSRQGRHAEAIEAIDQAVAIVDATGDQQRRCAIYNALGRIRQSGNLAGADEAYRRALELAGVIGDAAAASKASEGLESLRAHGAAS